MWSFLIIGDFTEIGDNIAVFVWDARGRRNLIPEETRKAAMMGRANHPMRSRSRFWLVMVLGLAGVFVRAAFAAAAEQDVKRPPNFLIIVADDLGWADVGYHGSRIPTPHLDRLAKEGLDLDQHYVAPVCTPTRAALLSGRYWSRFGNTAPSNPQVFPFGTVTLATALKKAGYTTALCGKWHLGSEPECGPLKFGFDQAYGSLAGGVGPWNHAYKRGPFTRTWHRNHELIEEEGHATDLLAREAIRFLETERTRPFFLYVPFSAVHHPLDEPEEWLEKGKKADPSRPQYAACLMHLDDAIGRLVKTLDDTGQRENTLVVFFSDNGGAHGPPDADTARYPGEYPKGQLLGRNEPLRGKKGQVYEGGIRTPALANWPGKLSPGKILAPLHVVDWMPTLCALAGVKPEQDLKWDGADIWPVLRGADKNPKARVFYWKGPAGRSSAVREGGWKLVVHRNSGGDRQELFHLSEDPGEQQNLASKNPEQLERLLALLKKEADRDNDAVVKK